MQEFLRNNFTDVRLMFRYGVAGMAAVVTNLLTIFIATHYFSLWYLWSAFLAFLTSMIVGFVLQKYWTFSHIENGRTHHELMNYLLIAVVGNGIGIALLYVLTSVLGIWYFASQVFCLGLIAITSYLINKNHTFRDRKQEVL